MFDAIGVYARLFMMIQPIFIVGIPRTGSTLWSNIIARDPNVMRFGEMHFLNPWHQDFRNFLRQNVGDLAKDNSVETLIDILFSGGQYAGLRGNYWEQIQKINPELLKQRMQEAVLASDRSLASIFRIVVDEPTRIRGYEKCLIKFPVYFSYVRLLKVWYPNAKIVHITRDPRATAMSKTNDPGGTGKRLPRHPRLGLLIRYVMKVFVVVQYIWSSYMHRKNSGSNNYALFRYEDLLANPEHTIRELCKFTGMDFNQDMLNPRKGQPSSLTGERRDGFDVTTAARWKQGLRPLEVHMITWVTRGSMRRLGYNPDTHPVYQGK